METYKDRIVFFSLIGIKNQHKLSIARTKGNPFENQLLRRKRKKKESTYQVPHLSPTRIVQVINLWTDGYSFSWRSAIIPRSLWSSSSSVLDEIPFDSFLYHLLLYPSYLMGPKRKLKMTHIITKKELKNWDNKQTSGSLLSNSLWIVPGSIDLLATFRCWKW